MSADRELNEHFREKARARTVAEMRSLSSVAVEAEVDAEGARWMRQDILGVLPASAAFKLNYRASEAERAAWVAGLSPFRNGDRVVALLTGADNRPGRCSPAFTVAMTILDARAAIIDLWRRERWDDLWVVCPGTGMLMVVELDELEFFAWVLHRDDLPRLAAMGRRG